MDMMLVGIVVALAAVGFLAFSFLKVDTPVVEEVKKERKQKQTKQDKIAARAAAASKKSGSSAADEAGAAEKAERKRLKEKEKKAARKAAALKAEQDAAAAAVAAAKAAAAASEPAPEEAGGKKKKKKKKSKAQAAKAEAAKEAAAAAVPEEEEEVVEPSDDGWVEIVSTKKEKVVVEEEGAAPAVVFSDEIQIASDKLALVIGTSGSTLALIQDATKTQIDIPKRGGVRMHTLITGPSKKAVAEAKDCLQQLVTKGYSTITHAGQVDQGIVVPSNFLGQIIGPRGATIKLLSKTGCKVNTPNHDDDSNLVTVVGDDDKVKEVIAAIQQIMDQGFSSMTHEGWVSKVLMVPRDQIGGVIGTAGENIKKVQTETSTRINIPDSKSDPVEVAICGQAADVEIAYAQIATSLLPPEPEEIPFEWSKEAILAIDLSF